jgi:asparagine synthase (glutamine-hydrolysing)
MCGICGVIQVTGEPRRVIDPAVLDWMTDTMTHRGPNDRGTYAADGVALGVRRLSIVDVDGGHQPIANESHSVWAVQNGELYNHLDLRRELQRDGHAFRTDCDTEILPHLYESFGDRYQERLRGMFGIAVWDAARRRAVLSRDRLGIKPLYYARSGDLLVFGSELKSVLASGLVDDVTLDPDAVDAYLTLSFVPGPRTLLAGVSKLQPGERLVVADGTVRVERYWSYPEPAAPQARAPDVREISEEFLRLLDESVRLRLMSDVPLGAMLSGGIDSSVIVALMARHMSEPVKTFSVGFTGAKDNELDSARSVAEALGTDHHELELTLDELPFDLEELVWFMDEPVADLSMLGFAALSQLAARHVTVALSGQGADEQLGGYTKHRAAALIGSLQRLPAPARGLAGRVTGRLPERLSRAGAALAADDPAERLLAMSGQLDPGLRRELAAGPLRGVDGTAARRTILERLGTVPDRPLATTLYLDGQLGLVDDMLHYFDRASMAFSLEVRVPFLDHRLVEFCATIPTNLKVHRSTTKYLLRRSVRGLVPDEVLERPKVGFFRGEVDEWLNRQLNGGAADYLLGPRPRYAEFLRRETVEELLRRHTSGSDRSHRHLLHAILLLEVWLSSYLPRATAAPDGSSSAPVAT